MCGRRARETERTAHHKQVILSSCFKLGVFQRKGDSSLTQLSLPPPLLLLSLSFSSSRLPHPCSTSGAHSESSYFKKSPPGNSLAVQWLRLHIFTAEGPGSTPGQGTTVPQAVRCGQKKRVPSLPLHLAQIRSETHSHVWLSLQGMLRGQNPPR